MHHYSTREGRYLRCKASKHACPYGQTQAPDTMTPPIVIPRGSNRTPSVDKQAKVKRQESVLMYKARETVRPKLTSEDWAVVAKLDGVNCGGLRSFIKSMWSSLKGAIRARALVERNEMVLRKIEDGSLRNTLWFASNRGGDVRRSVPAPVPLSGSTAAVNRVFMDWLFDLFS